VRLGDEGKFVQVYRSYPLTRPNAAIRLVYIMIHGAGRNADHYFGTALASTFLAGRLNETLVIAPRFAGNDGRSCKDPLAEGEIAWRCGGWPGGEPAVDNTTVHSFDLIDQLLDTLNDHKLFPNLQRIVLAGHSAGGQFVNRYSAVGRGPKPGSAPVLYVASDPSSYLYLDPLRLASGAKCSAQGGCSGEFIEYADASKCQAYNRWRYGTEQRTGYAKSVSDADMRARLIPRDVVYLLGELDTLPIAGFDNSCPAMAQGPNRLERGFNYWNYITTRYSAKHRLTTVPLCGHNARCIFTADQALKVVFTESPGVTTGTNP
jgi:pimeloyl-ACP methyl ester carboxylesterase